MTYFDIMESLGDLPDDLEGKRQLVYDIFSKGIDLNIDQNDLSIKNESDLKDEECFARCFVKSLYWNLLQEVVKKDISDLITQKQIKHLDDLFKKTFCSSDTYITNEFINGIPTTTSEEFYSMMISLSKRNQRYIISTIKDIDWKLKSDLLSSVQHTNIILFNETLEKIHCDLDTTFKLAYALMLCESQMHDYKEGVKTGLITRIKQYNYIKEYIQEAYPYLYAVVFNNKKTLKHDWEYLMYTSKYQMFNIGLSKIAFSNFMADISPEEQQLIVSLIPAKTYEIYQAFEIPTESQAFEKYCIEHSWQDMIEDCFINKDHNLEHIQYDSYRDSIDIERLKRYFTDDFLTKDYRFINAAPIRTYFDEFIVQLQMMMHKKRVPNINYWKLAHMICRSMYFDEKKFLDNPRKTKAEFTHVYRDLCECCGRNDCFNKNYRNRPFTSNDVLDDFLLILPSKPPKK